MRWLDILGRLVQGWAQDALSNAVQHWDRLRWQLFQSLLMVLLATVCGLTVLLLTALLVLLSFWDTHRYEALWALLLTYTGLAVWMVRRAGRLMAVVPAAAAPRGGACGGCCRASGRTTGA